MISWFSETQKDSTLKIFDLLNFCKLNYWVESGSLLLATRDGFIPKKEDFDVGAMHDEKKIKKFEDKLKEFKIPFQLSTYHGNVYKVKIKFENCIPIDIIFYTCYNDTLLSPQKYYSKFHRKFISPILYLYRKFINFNVVKNSKPENFELDDNSILYNVGTWAIPKKFIGNINFCSKSGFRIPEHVSDYLTYRYDDWMTPNKELWIFSIHDGAFSKLNIETIKGISSRSLHKKIFNEN